MTMHGCQACQAMMLESLYDLLDAEERLFLTAHLAGCPACQQASQRARADQQLLAAAARMEFPNVRFTPPTEETTPAATPPPVLLPLPAPVARKARWGRRLAVAAAVLLAL